MLRRVGKLIGSNIYVHWLYEDEVVPTKVLERAKYTLRDVIHGSHTYTCIKYDKKTENVTFQWSSTFNTLDEPIVDCSVLVRADGTTKIMEKKHNPQIWHRKYLWVKDDYKGFDVDESKRRAELYDAHLTKYDKSRIGYLSYWNRFKKRVGIE